MSVTIREPRESDSAAIATLLGELGYPAEAGDIPVRLRALAASPGAMTRVAESDGDVVGVMTAQVFPAIHTTPPAAWLTALVVAERARGKGVGQKLVAHAEAWAASQGAAKIALTSALHRGRAHGFYKSLGYEHTGVRLAKSLGAKS